MIPQAYPLYIFPEGAAFERGNEYLVVGWVINPDDPETYNPLVLACGEGRAYRVIGGFTYYLPKP